MSVAEVMEKEVVTVTEDVKVGELKELFDKYDFNAFPVLRDGALVGIVTKLDLLRTITTGGRDSLRDIAKLWAENVGDMMRTAVITLWPDDTILKAADFMVEFKLRSIPVMDGRKLVGIVSRSDILPYVLTDDGEENGGT